MRVFLWFRTAWLRFGALDVIMKLLPCAPGPSLTVKEAMTLCSNYSSAAARPEKTSEIALG